MKIRQTIALIYLSVFASTVSYAQPVANSLLPQVDKRVELVCIAARLADIKGFNDNLNPWYVKAIELHFTPFNNHPLIQYLKERKSELAETNWEIPAVAVHLTQPPNLAPVMAYAETAQADVWESRALFTPTFVDLLQRFYRDTKAEVFFKAQEGYYQAVSQGYEKQGAKLDKRWVNTFFGLHTTEDYFAIIALGVMEGAYMRVNFARNYRHTFTIIETTSFDSRGIPMNLVNPTLSRLMLHEYIHAFTNQLIDKHKTELQSSAETLLKHPRVFNLVKNTFYGNWEYLLYESLVRACSIKYMTTNTGLSQDIEKEITGQEKAGFLWIRGLIKELDNYEANRNRYKNMGEYMPQILLYFRKTAEAMRA